MATRYVSNRAEVDRKLKQRKTKALTAIGIFLVASMKLLVPVDTGRLKSSLTYDVGDDSVVFGASSDEGSSAESVFYAIFIELGTIFMAAKPFIKPSVFDNQSQIQRLAQEKYNEVI